MVPGLSTRAFSDNTEILDSDSNDYTSKVGKDSTIIQSKVTVITEKRRKKSKFAQNLLFHMASMFFWQ